MKSLKVTSIVLTLHACLIGAVLFQPGCCSFKRLGFSQKGSDSDWHGVAGSDSKKAEVNNIEEMSYFDEVDQYDYIIESDVKKAVSMVQPVTSKAERFAPKRPVVERDAEVLNPILSSVNESSDYVVKKGDSLWLIAKKHNVLVDEITASNGMKKDGVLKIGQKLRIPGKKGVSGVVGTRESTGGYVIAKGDTLSGIAARFKVSSKAIMEANGLSNDRIVAGKTLVIPGSMDVQSSGVKPTVTVTKPKTTTAASSMQKSKDGAYQIQKGESLSVIAKRFNTTVANLMKWNKIEDARKIRAGQYIQVAEDNTVPESREQSAAVIKTDPFEEFDHILPASENSVTSSRGNSFDLFDDENLFDTTGEIPVVSLMND